MVSVQQENNASPNEFYRDYYGVLVGTLLLAIFLMIALVGVVLYQVSHRPEATFVAEAEDGKTMNLTAFSEPNYLPTTLTRWASKAAVSAYTFDFVNYDKQISLARPYFTNAGWNDYQASVKNLIQAISQRQLFVNSVVAGTPVISNQGPLPGKDYVWRMQIPFLVTYQSAENTSRQNFLVIMTVVKVPTYIDPTGIGIDQFIMK